eukprot:CAMPEP_0119298864 /NCGR_PEP_ID=MMETSP1333-20130426/994_1 /TAXON_ID=418940 /ORGANISM="Scyphosphaera apsteinii, Strain RCC1455" /LENGTH=186 /DNA_ID=CAMNT_0007300081 /DNA_START=13 /DNA_END=574 /DNA_ORIENTATION=-
MTHVAPALPADEPLLTLQPHHPSAAAAGLMAAYRSAVQFQAASIAGSSAEREPWSRLFTAGDNIAHVRCRIEMTGVPITSLSRLAAAIVGIFAVVRGAVTQAKASKTLATMTWADVSDVNDADACVLIGEEAEEDGRSWFACSDVPQDSDVECTLNDTNPNSPIATWLCKAPRVQAKQLFSHESAS